MLRPIRNARVAVDVRRLTLAAAVIVMCGTGTAAPAAAAAQPQQPGHQQLERRDPPGPTVTRSKRGVRNQNYSTVNSPTVMKSLQGNYVTTGRKNHVQGAVCRPHGTCQVRQRDLH